MGYDLTKTGGGDWLTDGRHVVKVVSHKSCEANSGSRGVEYEFVQESTGRRQKASYWMYYGDGSPNKGAWRLRTLAEAAKLDNDAIRDFNPSMLVGRTVGIVVEKEEGEKWHNVIEEFVPTAKDIAQSREAGDDSQSQASSQDTDRHEQSSEGESQGTFDEGDESVPF